MAVKVKTAMKVIMAVKVIMAMKVMMAVEVITSIVANTNEQLKLTRTFCSDRHHNNGYLVPTTWRYFIQIDKVSSAHRRSTESHNY